MAGNFNIDRLFRRDETNRELGWAGLDRAARSILNRTTITPLMLQMEGDLDVCYYDLEEIERIISRYATASSILRDLRRGEDPTGIRRTTDILPNTNRWFTNEEPLRDMREPNYDDYVDSVRGLIRTLGSDLNILSTTTVEPLPAAYGECREEGVKYKSETNIVNKELDEFLRSINIISNE